VDKWYVAETVSMTDLAKALRDVRMEWTYAERMEDTILTRRDVLLDGTVPLEHYTHGRAFGPDLEVAWWRNGNKVQACSVVVEGEPPMGIDWTPYPDSTDDWKAVPQNGQSFLLAGERDPDAPAVEPRWSTARIPRYLEYPADGSWRQVALIEQPYRYADVIVARRLVAVVEAKEWGDG
jgi:hypothetical protein